ncbi:MAG: methionine ABC transporter ATP-binding protein, partial [Anaerolineales bacterium]|nr:methionine ABC transporter ATP-binding protein [Anaerolineales bacterium]
EPCHPYTVQLLRAIPSEAVTVDELEEISGSVPRLIRPPTGCRFHPRCGRRIPICSEAKPKETEISPDHTIACHLF